MTAIERDHEPDIAALADWRWQLRNAITGLDELNSALASFTDLRVARSELTERISTSAFNFKVTPFMLSALAEALGSEIPGAWSAFCASFVPTEYEAERAEHPTAQRVDSIGEDLAQSHPAPGITRFYRNRALLRVSHMCPAYCRYCFRRRMVGDASGAWNQGDVDSSLSYIRADASIREVILSGGEPLVLGDERIRYVLRELGKISHVRRVRIDTKALTMLPQRVTNEFCRLLRNSKVAAVVSHFTHEYELAPEVEQAAIRLADAGIPLYAHVPLLRTVNDDETTLLALLERLVDLRVRPYYLIQFIPTTWTEHFRVSIARGIELITYLQQHCTGLAVPTYIVYLPEGHGKVPVSPSYLAGRTEDGYIFKAHDGSHVVYREPTVGSSAQYSGSPGRS